MKLKKIVISVIIALLVLMFSQSVLAVKVTNNMETNTASEIIEMKEKNTGEIDEYNRKYGSESYGMTAYILNKVSLFSIPFCFIGIVVGALYQYVLGTRRLDMKHKGFGLIIAFTTILVICQVLPLIFAIIVRGWRG